MTVLGVKIDSTSMDLEQLKQAREKAYKLVETLDHLIKTRQIAEHHHSSLSKPN